MVVKALADVARAGAGEQSWSAICAQVGSDDHFVGTRDYPEELVGDLVAAVAVALGASREEVLHRLGRHWIRYTAQEGWGPLLQALGPDLVTALGRLDGLHVRVGLALPHLRPPSFQVVDVSPDGLVLLYRSTRTGLEPMVCGLVEELGQVFDCPVAVTHDGRRDGAAVFAVRFVPAHEVLTAEQVVPS
ncbi:MAG: Heme binding domain protein [Frankiales bacterium]|nr:Heme binding domain protein [Frankiales bacterium]